MYRTLITGGLAVVLGLGLCALSPLAGREPPPVPPDKPKGGDLPADRSKIDPGIDVQKQIQDLQDQVNKLKTDSRFIKIELLEGDLKRLGDDLKNLKVQQQQMETRILDKLDQMERRTSQPRVATEVYGQAPMGYLRLVNRTPWSAAVVLDNVNYPLAPGEERALAARPAGAFGYEVILDGFGVIKPFSMSALAANETRVITINR